MLDRHKRVLSADEIKEFFPIGSKWKHFKGGLYQIVGISLGVEEEESVTRIEYARLDDMLISQVFSRTWLNFSEPLIKENFVGERFERIS